MPEYTWPGRPPAGSILDTTSPYYANMKAAYLFNDASSGNASGTPAKNLVTNAPISLNPGQYGAMAWSPAGLVMTGAATLGIDIYDNASDVTPLTLVILYKPLLSGLPNLLGLVGTGSSAGSRGDLLIASTTSVSVDAYGYAPLVGTVPDMTGLSVMTAVNCSSSGQTLYHNGVNMGTNAAHPFPATGSVIIGGPGTSGCFQGTVIAAYLYSGRLLTDAEHAHLSAFPYAPIIPMSAPASPATAFTLSGPASGITGAASANFTATPNGTLAQAEAVALTDGGAGGTFTPTSLSFLSGGTAAQSFTYTPSTSGAKTITATASPALGTAPTAAYTPSAVVASSGSIPRIFVYQPTGCKPGDTETAYIDIATVNGATDADTLPVITYSLINLASVAGFSATIARLSQGLYQVTIPTPLASNWCDDICIMGTATVAGKVFNWLVKFSIPTVAADAAGSVILQPSEHINEIPLDIANALLKFTLGEYIDPTNPSTSGLRLTTAGLANTPISGGLTTGQVTEINSILDIVTRGTVIPTTDIAAAILAAPLITIPGTFTTSGGTLVLTQKQEAALGDAILGGDNVTSGPPVASGTVTVTYYLRGSAHIPANIVQIATLYYDANKQQVSRTDKIAQPFPSF